MNNVKSLKIALVIVIIAAAALVANSYSRQKKAENRTLAVVNAIKAANSLEDLQNNAENFLAYSGVGNSAAAGRWVGSTDLGNGSVRNCYIAQHGSDAGETYCNVDSTGGDWWNPFSWF